MARASTLALGLALTATVAVALPLASCRSFRTSGASEADASDAVDGGPGEAGPVSAFSVVHQGDAGAGALRGVWASSPTDVYAVGDDGVVLHFTGDGDPARSLLGAGVDLGGVWGSGPDDVLAVATQRNTNQGPVFERINGRWVEIGVAPHGLHAVWGIGDMRFAAGNDGAIYNGPPDAPLSTGHQLGPNQFVQATNFAPILYSLGGNSTTSVMGAADVDSTTYWDGTIWHVFDDPIDRTRAFRAIWGAPGDAVDIYEGANYYGLWHFTGKSNLVIQLNEEKDEPQKFTRYLWGIWGATRDRIVCVGDGGRIMTFDALTQTVKTVPSPTGKDLFAVFGTSEDDIWIVGDDQLVLRGRMP